MKSLERVVARDGGDEEVKAAAKEALDKARKYGESQLADAEEIGTSGHYFDAANRLAEIEKAFAGTDISDKAEELLDAWKKDDRIKKEIEAGKYLAQAEEEIRAKRYRRAAAYLLRIVRYDKYEDTKVREIAQETLSEIEKKL
jgi:hypothetical protein